jgi:hypothetical protein
MAQYAGGVEQALLSAQSRGGRNGLLPELQVLPRP